jgi:hypothetical protein
MKYAGSLVAAVSVLATSITSAKCATMSLRDRFADAQSVTLLVVTSAHDAPVPWPYGISKGAVPGKDLTLRVLRSWKGPLREGDVIYGWTQGRTIEDSYPQTDVGAQILVFSAASLHEIRACNTADPSRLHEVSAELDAIIQGQLGRGS